MSDGLFGLATAYWIVISVVGCYIAARLAPDRAMAHALVLGGIGVVISAIGAAVTWNLGPAFGPDWYPLLLIVISISCAWIGRKLSRSELSGSRRRASSVHSEAVRNQRSVEFAQ